jgi:hypothetical protein
MPRFIVEGKNYNRLIQALKDKTLMPPEYMQESMNALMRKQYVDGCAEPSLLGNPRCCGFIEVLRTCGCGGIVIRPSGFYRLVRWRMCRLGSGVIVTRCIAGWHGGTVMRLVKRCMLGGCCCGRVRRGRRIMKETRCCYIDVSIAR